MVLKEGRRASKRPDRPARLIDVAREANVSRATAARALGGYGLVGEQTRETVISAALALNYRTNELARAIRSGKSLTIGVVVADIANSFFSGAVRAIIETADQFGYRILVLNTDDDLSREIEAVRVLLEKRVDGLIVVPSSPTCFGHLVAHGEPVAPLMLLDRRVPQLKVGTVTTDDYDGAKKAIELFVARGHRRIGMLVSTVGVDSHSNHRPETVVSTVDDRVDGALAALRQAECWPAEDWIRYSRNGLAYAEAAARIILSLDPRPTALLATNEDVALGVLAACNDLGLLVGRDVSLISFDDSPWAKVFSPPISVVRRPVHELGSEAVSALIGQINQDLPLSITLPTTLIDRSSVADIRDLQIAGQLRSGMAGYLPSTL